MSTRDVLLDGGSPWGFRMHGGADVGQPLRISRVNPGSKAAQKGVREGDVISSINGQSTRSISNSDAHALLRNAGETLHLGLNEECTGSPKRRLHRNIQESKSEPVRRSTTNGVADSNCNIKSSAKGEGHHGKQNGGLKENSDSKGPRRRRRSTSQQPSTSDVKEESDATAGDNKARRRRRSRGGGGGANRRKCDGEQNTDGTDTERKKKGSRRSSVERIRSSDDAEGNENKRVRRSKTETKQEPQVAVEASSTKSRTQVEGEGSTRKTEERNSSMQTTNLEVETEVREEREGDIGHASEELEITCGKVETNYIANMEEGPLATDEIQTEVPVTLDRIQAEVPLAVDEIQTEVPFVTDELLTEAPVKLDEMQTHIPLVIDDIRTEVRATLDEMKTEAAVDEVQTEVTCEFQTEVPVTLDQVQTEIPVAIDIQSEVPATLEKVRTELPLLMDELETEVPIATDEIRTEVPAILYQVQKEVPVSMKYLQTEAPVRMDEIHREVPLATDDLPVATGELQTEVPAILDQVQTEAPLLKDDLQTEERVTMNEIQTEVSVIREEVVIEVPVIREEVQTGVPVIREEVETEVPVIREEVETEVPVIREDVETGVPVIREEVETVVPVIREEVETGVPVIMEEVETEVPVIREEVETEVPVIREDVETGVPVIREEVETVVPVTREEVETEVPVIREEEETGVPVIMEEVETEVPVIREEGETGVPVIKEEVETGVPVIREEVETGVPVPVIMEEVETEVPVITEEVKTGVPVTISCNSIAYRNDEVVDKHSIADIFSSCVKKGESQTRASTLCDDVSGENDILTYSVVLELSENENEEKGNSTITVNLKLKDSNDVTETKDATKDGTGERKDDDRSEPIDLSDQNERRVKYTGHAQTQSEYTSCVETAKNYSETEKCKTSTEYSKDTASEKVGSSQAINENISSQSENERVNILNNTTDGFCNGNVLERTAILNHEVVGSKGGYNETECSFFINVIEEQDVVMETEEVWEEVEELVEAEDTSAHLQEVKLSAEDRELLDPSPLMEAAEEETLRRFLHSLNLTDYSKEAVSARNGGAEELFATRRDKRRASLETYQGACSQQRGLEVIVEENSSDYSDVEARAPRGWEEAIFIPETNEVVFLNDEDESSSSGQDSNRNSALYRAMAEVDVFSEDMENALENVVRVELADSSDDEEVVQRSWKKERQDGVEIVYLDEDRQEADGEEDPDALYENFEFRDSGDSSDGIYENVEFVSQRKSVVAIDDESCAVYENVVYLKREDEHENSPEPKEREMERLLSVEEKEVSGYFISVEAIENDAVESKPGNPDDLDVESITPTNRSRRESSSSDAGSHGTAFYCPGGFSPVSSDADVSSFTEDVESRTLRRSRKKPEAKRYTVKTLKELATEKVLSLHCGSDILSVLGIPSSKDADAISRFQLLNKCMGKPPLSGSLPDLSSVKLENNGTRGGVAHQQRRPDAPCQPPESLSGSQWLGMPTKEDPNLFVCLSPSQRQSYHKGEDPTPEEAENLLDLHKKFIQRRSYHETTPPPPPSRQFYGIRHCYVNPHSPSVLTSLDSKIGEEEEEGERRGCPRSRSSSRLLAILRAVSADHDSNVEESQPPSSAAASSPPPLPPPPHANAMLRPSTVCCDDLEYLFHSARPPKSPSWHTATLTTKDGEETNYKERLRVKSLSDWLQLVRCGATNRDDNGTRSVDSTPPVSACISTQSSPGPIRRAKGPSPESKEQNGLREHQKLKQQILERRFSLPEKQLDQAYQPYVQVIKTPVLPTSAREDERHEQQLKLLHQRQQERLRNQQLALREQQDGAPPKQNEGGRKLFDADSYTISKQGDIAIINIDETKSRPKSMPPSPPGGEFFRQQMYNEYMHKVAERAERRRQKVIRLSSAVTRDQEAASGKQSELLENEFMGRVRARMDKLGLKYEEERGEGDGEGGDPLPKHLQEFLVIANNEDNGARRRGGVCEGSTSSLLHEIDEALHIARGFLTATSESGVWSPSQKTSSSPIDPNLKDKEVQEKKKREGDETPPVVWTPKSAGASPTSERKEFRPISFESPKLQRKNRGTTSTPTPTKPDNLSSGQEQTTTFSSIFLPWQQPLSLQQQHSRDDSTVSVGSTIQSPTSEKSVASSTISSTIDRRLVQSQSAPASGLSALAAGGSTSTKLPRAQNPTITLLQKAREGQLPRGALYLDHKMNSKEADKAYISPNEILYSVRKEYESDGDGDQRKKMVDLAPRKFEGIGPMTKEGIPMVLRSEVKDTNQAKWYKRMYDSLHRAGKDDDYITIRYKPRRGHYPYIAPGGYLSEPEPALYDSDIGYSAKYATLDRRRIKNKENDFTTSTLPRSRYVPHPASIKYATEVYKNQPGRIEDYEPGRSSISDKETKQWWDEVLDIFDGWLETHSPHHQHHPNYCSSSFMTADGIYQRQQASAEPKTTPTNKPFMTYALKESGYESDSTLVFKRRDENLQSQLSPAEHKLAYKTIQKGGEVPLQGLRKPAPERPKDISEIEYFPISPHLTRIRVHKQNITPLREIVCYPVTATYTNVPPIFSSYKRTAPSYAQVVPQRTSVHPPPPSPPKRLSSHHSSTLRLWSKMKMPSQTHTSPIRPRHESCFKETNVSFLRDRLSHKLGMNSRSDRMTRTASSSPLATRTRAIVPATSTLQRSRSAPEEITINKQKSISSSSEHRSRRSQQDAVRKLSRSPELSAPIEVRKILQKQKEKDIRERMGSRSLPPGTVVRSSTTLYSSARNAGRHCHPEDKALRVTVAISAKGRELLQPRTATNAAATTTTVTTTTSPTGSSVYKTSSCSKSPTPSASPILGSQRGRQRTDTSSPCYHSPTSSSSSKSKMLTSPSPLLPATPLKRAGRSTSRECMRTASSSLVLLAADEGNRRIKKNSSIDTKKKVKEKSVNICPKSPLPMPKTTNKSKATDKEEKDTNRRKGKRVKTDGNGESKRTENSKKNGHSSKPSSCSKLKVNGEEKRKNKPEKKTGTMPRVETMPDLTLVSSDENPPAAESAQWHPSQNVGPLNTESFFQHLLLRDISSPTPSLSSSICRSSILERARRFHEQISGNVPSRVHRTESTLGLLNVYLAQKRPVTDSKFRSLDRELSQSSRSPSPVYRRGPFPIHSQFKDESSCHEADGGRFYSLGPSRSRTPDSDGRHSVKVRSSSEPPVLASPTRSQSPSRERPPIVIRSQSPSLSPTRSPACRKIRGTRSQTVKTVESIGGPKRKGIRARSAGDAEDVQHSLKKDLRTPPLSVANSTSSLNLSHITDHGEYQTYVMELMHSTKKSERFRELHKFYSSLERLGELERTASTGDLRPRLKGEEVIDYDRWMQLRKKEKAEQEMKILYRKLKEDQKEKDLLFQPKDAESLRWRSNLDRGLRCKERSVENLKHHFGKLSSEESDLEAVKRKELAAKKDVYKPLWRGSSVLNLATCLATVTGSRRGRPVLGDEDTSIQSASRSLSRHSSTRTSRGIGSRLWSSLSMDQVNALKSQLSEIYSTVSNLKREKFMNREHYEISVPPERGKSSKERKRKDNEEREALHVRCNSLLTRDQLYSPVVRRRETRRTESMKADSISSLPHWKKNGNTHKPKPEVTRSYSDRVPTPKPMSETEKKRLSMTLSQEVLDRVTKKQRKTSAPIIRARETRGAIAAAAAAGKGKRKSPSPSTSPVLSETVSPRTCYSLEMSEEDASASRKNDFLLVLAPSDGSRGQRFEVEKAVEEWANSKPSTSKAVSERKIENGVLARLVRTTSASETESASSDASMRTVIHCTDSKEKVHHKVKYFEKKQIASTEPPSSGRVCRSASDIRTPRHPALTCTSRAKSAPSAFSSAVAILKSDGSPPVIPPAPTKLQPSQSFSDLKELFGEQSRLRYATVPLMTRKRQESASPQRSTPEAHRSHQGSVSPHRGCYSSSSTESLFHHRSRSTSPDPTKYWRAYLRMVKRGDVRRLRDKFESLEDIYYFSAREHDKKRNVFSLKRYRSDPEIARNFLARRGTDTNRVVVRGQEIGDVRRLRRHYETYNRGRSRGRKTRALSPVLRIPFRAEDRFMPHINVISKTASLQSRSSTISPHRLDGDSYTHFQTGEVRRIREKFESQLSLMGQMFTSTPDMHELRDIAPYLGCHWVAHKYPDTHRSLSSPELRPAPPVPSHTKDVRPRPSSSSPTRSRRQPLSILKPQQSPQQHRTPDTTVSTCAITSGRDVFANQAFDPSIHRPLYRYQPADSNIYSGHQKHAWNAGASWWWRYSPTNPTLSSRPTVTFKEPVYGPVPPRSYSPRERAPPESPHRYVESEVTIHYRSPVRSEAKEALSEEELARRQAEAMRRIYQEERRRKYLQELQDMHSRRHTDNFTPSQKSPIPLNRYDDILDDVGSKGKSRDRTPEPKLVARALYNFVGQTSRELSFRRGDIIFVRRQIDKNWYEGEHNAMVGLFPFNYVEIIPYDGIRTIPKRPSEGQARAKFNFIAQTHLELSLVKGELVVLTRRVDDNWFEGRIGNRKGIFPVSYVEILSEPGEKPVTPLAPPLSSKPITLPASHTVLMNGSGIKQSMGQHSYQPTSYFGPNKLTSAFTSSNPYATLPRQSQTMKQPLAPVNQTLHIDTHSEPVPYRALYNYRPQNEDELELCEGDTVYVMEKCDDGWYVGSSQRTSYFGTFPGNYVERI